MGILRVSDQTIMVANKAGMELFGFTSKDLGKTTLWDIVAQVDWNFVVREATRSVPGGVKVDMPRSGALTFKRSDGVEFISWFYARDIPEIDGVAKYRALVLLEQPVFGRNNSFEQELRLLESRNYFGKIAGNAAHEINNSLVVLQELLRNLTSVSLPDRERIESALKRLEDVGSQMVLVGSKGQVETSPEKITEEKGNKSDLLQKSILVVDDDANLLEVVVNLIASAGYLVCSASNSKEALEHFEKGNIDCVIIDVVLGNDLGVDLASQISRISPSTSVIFMSGFSSHVEKIRVEGIYEVLRKPFPMFDLLEKIDNITLHG